MSTLSDQFRACRFAELPGWDDDDQRPALSAFRRTAAYASAHAYRTGALGLAAEAFAPAFAAASMLDEADFRTARHFFEHYFEPAFIRPDPGQPGLVTGYFEPELEASDVRTPRFNVPLLSRPDDLVDVDEADRPAPLATGTAFARRTPHGLAPYFDRGEIERGALADRGLEIAWLEDRVDVYFVHVQGSARLRMQDGRIRRVGYAAKSGHPFLGAGKVLLGLGELDPATVSMQTIRAWLKAHPERVDEILWQNRSYIFFRDFDLGDPDLGPVGAAKVQLTAGRSMAVDRLLHTFGTPIFVDAPALASLGPAPFRRLMIAQDTGSAIVGPARGDLFAGTGNAAGEGAGVVRHAADFYALVPRQLLGRGSR